MLLLHRVGAVGRFCACLRRRWQLGAIPSAAQRLDQLHGGDHLRHLQRVQGLLIAEQGGLGGDHVDVGIDAESVALRLEVEELLRGL